MSDTLVRLDDVKRLLLYDKDGREYVSNRKLTVFSIAARLETLQAVEAEPVVHSEWRAAVKHPSLYRCTHCGYEPPEMCTCDGLDNNEEFVEECERCPQCGAHMA